MKKYFSVLKIFLLEKCLPCVPGSLLSVMMTIRLFLRKKVKISQIPQYDNVKLFDINEIKDATLNPLFIMGCGMSINDLSAVEKKFIESSTSVGINLFVI